MISGTRVDFWRNTLVKRAFIGGASETGGAGTFALIELFNVAESGVLLICDQIHISVGAACVVELRDFDATLTTAGDEGNKYLGEAAPLGQIKHFPAALPGDLIATFDMAAGRLSQLLTFVQPFIIPEGRALVVAAHLVETKCTANFEWIEL